MPTAKAVLTDNLMKGKIQLFDWSLIIYKILSNIAAIIWHKGLQINKTCHNLLISACTVYNLIAYASALAGLPISSFSVNNITEKLGCALDKLGIRNKLVNRETVIYM